MNDNIIINIISKTYFSIVSFFVFIFLLLSSIFIILQNGLSINELNLSTLQVKQLYIKWNEKLDISIKEINLKTTPSKNESKVDFNTINSYLKKIKYTTDYINSFQIQTMHINDMNGSFDYKRGEEGYFSAHSPTTDLDSKISFDGDIIALTIKNFLDTQHKLSLHGSIFFNSATIKLYNYLTFDIAKEANFTLFSKSDLNTTNYKLISNHKIHNFKDIITIANLPKEVHYWAYDAITMNNLNISDIHGFINHHDISDAYKNIHIRAAANKLDYAYNPKLDSVHSEVTNLEFKNGVLYIRPQNAYSYGMPLEKSWLKIDFTQKEELLTLQLLFNASLNKDMLHILNTYKIKLPFLQKSGSVFTNLIIKVGLHTISVDAKGDFIAKKANFDYLGLNVDVSDAHIKLDNYNVSVKDMSAKYKDIATAKVDVTYDANKAIGEVSFAFNKVNFSGLTYQSTAKPIKAKYFISPHGDKITTEDIQLYFKKRLIKIEPIVMPFNLKKLLIELPGTYVQMDNIGSAFVSGTTSLKDFSTDLDIDILKFSYDGIELSQTNTPLKVKYNKSLLISSKKEIHFNISGSKYKLKNLSVSVLDNQIRIKHTKVEIGKYIKAKVYAKYSIKDKISHISLNNFTLLDPNTHKVLYKRKKILLSGSMLEDKIKISSGELDATFYSQDSGWRLKLNSLGRIATHSDILKKFHLTTGDFTIYKNKTDKYTRFISNMTYPYKLLVKNNKPLSLYKIAGRIYKEKVYLTINDKIDITIKDDINVNLKNSIVNINEVLHAAKEIGKGKSAKPLNISLEAKNSQIFVTKDRAILYDKFNLQYFNKILTAQLSHTSGEAGLRLEGENFHLYGKNFNDLFMNKLFALSQFSNGSLDFSMDGNINDYEGVMYIKKTTIKDYKTLNNVLAFVNTVPSLVTFNIPGYSKNGLLVEKAYINFTSKKNLLTLSNIYLDSKEIDIVGKGTFNTSSNLLDVILNLKTDLGSNLSKIPLVGYIIFDGDSISTTLSIKGDASNPSVKSLIAKDIVVAPLNIIERTLTLPYKLIKDASDNLSNKK